MRSTYLGDSMATYICSPLVQDDGGNSIVCGTAEAFLVNNVLFVVFKATECIIGLVLAFQTRKIKLKGLRESSQVTLASYIFAFTLVVFVVAQYLTTRQNTIYIVQLLVVGTLLLVMPVLILTVIFIPKVNGCECVVLFTEISNSNLFLLYTLHCMCDF